MAGDYDHLGTQLVSQMTELSEEYLEPYLLEVGVFAAAILIAAILTMILSWKIAYYISMVGTLVIGGCSVFIFNQIKPELDAIGSSLDFFGLDEAMEIERLTLVLWCLVWALVLVLSVYGVIISRRENRIQAEEMPRRWNFWIMCTNRCRQEDGCDGRRMDDTWNQWFGDHNLHDRSYHM